MSTRLRTGAAPPAWRRAAFGAWLALLWQFTRLMQVEASSTEGASQAHGLGEMIEKRASDRRKARLRRWALRLFSPAGRPQAAAAARSRRRSATSTRADAVPARSGPRNGRGPVPLSAADAPAHTPIGP